MIEREIVLIEDSDAHADITIRTLQEMRIANPVRRFTEGVSALVYVSQAFSTNDPALFPAILVIDLQLPGIGGLEILRRLRLRFAIQMAHTLSIVLSSTDRNYDVKESDTIGANSFLTKPLKPRDIIALLERFPEYWLLSGETSATEEHG